MENPFGLNLEEKTEIEEISDLIDCDIPVFLHGKSGDGKTGRVLQIDPELEFICLSTSAPEDIAGKTVYDGKKMVDMKPTWFEKLEEKCKAEPDKNHVIFFDELSNADPKIQGYILTLISERSVAGKWRLPKNARIVAAGNEIEDSDAAYELIEPLERRFAHVNIETDVRTWLTWASSKIGNIHPAVCGFIAYRGMDVLRSNGKNKVDPRKWQMVSKFISSGGSVKTVKRMVGEDIGTDFDMFCHTKSITVDEVINHEVNPNKIYGLKDKYFAAVVLSSASEKEYSKVRNFVKKLGPELCSMYDLLWSHSDPTRLEMVAEERYLDESENQSEFEYDII